MSENQNVSEGTEEKNSPVTADGTEALLQSVFESRSVQQLADRLLDYLYPMQKKKDNKGREKVGRPTTPLHLIDNISDEQKEKVETICQNAAPREDQLEKLSLALAYLHSAVTDTEWMKSLTLKLSDRFIAWEKPERCVEASDKLPVKQVSDWFKVTLDAKGIDYLADIVFKLPYNLWGDIEKIFQENGKKELMLERVKLECQANRITPDLFYWLWKNKDKEALAALRDKFLTDANQLFKVLRQDVKGNYLKAQRDLKKLLLDNEDFQEVLMNGGERSSVLELIRCTKRLPLLDNDERQSLLVKIFNLHPEYKTEIEERSKGPRRVNAGRTTSRRGYNKRVAELKHLIEVEIPENSKAIEVARAHGDLSENSEFKFAKERQRFLGQRRREWEESLIGLQIVDFYQTRIDKIIIPGCTFELKTEDGATQEYTILGLLDGESEKNIISHDTPLAKLVMGNEVGATITLPDGRRATITSVKPLTPEMLKYVADE